MKMYKAMLDEVVVKIRTIEQISLEDESYNNEYRELAIIRDCLIRLIKIENRRFTDESRR